MAYSLYGTWHNFEVGRDVAPKHTSFQSLNVASDICFRREEVAIVGDSMGIFVTVRHNDMSIISFNLPRQSVDNSHFEQ